jgi:hypothetical protein
MGECLTDVSQSKIQFFIVQAYGFQKFISNK